MTSNNIDKAEVLEKAKIWFRDTIIKKHIVRTKKLSRPSEFKINPFLVQYLSKFSTGDITPEGIAKALVYPKALGTSINTSFGQNLQSFVNDVLGSVGSMVQGIDIEFTDQSDGRKKYCQLKAGPNTINKDDVKTVIDHFATAKRLAVTNSNRNIQNADLIVGVMYGDKTQLSAHYKAIEEKYFHPVYVGSDFWLRMTGDNDFYQDLIGAFAGVAADFDEVGIIEDAIKKLASTDQIKKLSGQ